MTLECNSDYKLLEQRIQTLEAEKQTLYLLLGELILKNQMLRDRVADPRGDPDLLQTHKAQEVMRLD
jgi:hypothetical protein